MESLFAIFYLPIIFLIFAYAKSATYLPSYF